MSESQGRRIVIIGGGIIGSTTAYFLSHHPLFNPQKDTITLLEATKIAGGASGKAGGLLGLWAYPDCLVPLSYQLHQDLANKHGGAERWGYRALHCGEIEAQGILATHKPTGDDDDDDDSDALHPSDGTRLPKRSPKALSLLRAARVPPDLDWLAASGLQRYEEMGTPQTTAQVHPYDFTTSMAQLAQEKGVRIVYGSAVAIEQQQQEDDDDDDDDDDENTNTAVTGVTYTTRDQASNPPLHLPASTIILATGPWTPTLHPSTPISSHRAHSITIRPSRPLSPHALFTTIHLPDSVSTPEIYPRPNNQVYVCGSTDSLVPLPLSSDLVPCDTSACDALFHHVASVSAPLRDGCVTARQACYLPVVCRTTTSNTASSSSSSSSGPLVGPTRVRGLFMGAGHSCWGIQNGPATGKILAEYVFEGEAKSARVGGLDPRNWGV